MHEIRYWHTMCLKGSIYFCVLLDMLSSKLNNFPSHYIIYFYSLSCIPVGIRVTGEKRDTFQSICCLKWLPQKSNEHRWKV